MKKTILIQILLLCAISIQSRAQTATKDKIKSSLGPNDFPELIQSNIPGAPILGKPQLIMGDTFPVMGEGYGWAAPAVYDWNGDGKKDLLIGEFGSGSENNLEIGNLIRVYRNIGSDDAPKFDDFYSYAHGANADIIEDFTSGAPLSIHTFCCLPFTPHFTDLNNDGFMDLLSGQYSPGYITWFHGSENGFLPGEELEEVYKVRASKNAHSLSFMNPDGRNYWQYSAADFGDFDDDGNQDMIVGGGALRLAKNIGSKFKPLFGKRELLLDINGNPLKICEMPEEELTNKSLYNPIYKDEDFYWVPPPVGVTNAVPYVVDWDQDSVLDILVTHAFTSGDRGVAVTYFRGLKTKEGLRFEEGIPLFTSKNGEKAFPGSWLNIYVTDWNNDGVNDLLIGTSIATLNGTFNHELSWQWEHDTGIGKKNPSYYSARKKKAIEQQINSAEAYKKKSGLTDEELKKKNFPSKSGLIKHYYGNGGYKNKTLAHKGYVYVMLGEKRN